MRRFALGLPATITLVLAGWALVIGFVAALVLLTEHGFEYFSRDPASTFDASPFVGVLSQTGVLVTWGAAIVSLFAGAFVLRARGRSAATPLLLFGAAAAYLAIDDLFLLHDDILSHKVGIEQEAVLIAYAALAIGFLWWYRSFLRAHEWPLLAAAVGALAVAFLLDFEEIHHHIIENDEIKRWVEDGAKLLGLALLAAYLLRLSAGMLAHAHAADTSDEEIAREGSQAETVGV